MDRQQAHQLLDHLDPGQLAAVCHLLEVMVDPVARAVAAAPPDDEPVTDQSRRRFVEGQAWFAGRGGKGIPMEEVMAEFGAKPEDFR
jgi:hypothetical protein